MKLVKAVTDNVETIRNAFNLIETDLESPYLAEMILAALSHQERLEVTKGMFFVVKLLFRSISYAPEPSVVNQLAANAKNGKLFSETDEQNSALTLARVLSSMDNDGGSFYLQLFAIKNPAEVTFQLIHIFEQVSFKFYDTDIKRDSLTALGHFRRYVNEITTDKIKREQELNAYTNLMVQESSSVELALQMVEILSDYFTVKRTEDNEELYYLNEKAYYADEIVEVAYITDQVELLKGVCIVSCLFLALYLTEGSILPIIDDRRAQLIVESYLDNEENEHATATQHIALNLMTHVASLNEEAYYEEVEGVDDLYEVMLSLNTSLYRTAREGLRRSSKEIAASLRHLLNNKRD